MFEIFTESGDLSLEAVGTAISRVSPDIRVDIDTNSPYETDGSSGVDSMSIWAPSNGVQRLGGMMIYSKYYDDRNNPPDSSLWYRLEDGAALYVGPTDRVDWWPNSRPYWSQYMGYDGICYFALTDHQNLSQYSGYLSVYNESGGLVWSANASGLAPQIVHVVHIPPSLIVNGVGVSVNLASFGFPVNELYLLGPGQGRVAYDEVNFTYVGISANRVGNFLYLNGMYSDTVGYTVGEMFGSDGLYVPIARIR